MSNSDDELKARVENVLLKYDPTKLHTASTLMNSFDGKEGPLMNALLRKYGPEPSAAEAAELRAKKGLPVKKGSTATTSAAVAAVAQDDEDVPPAKPPPRPPIPGMPKKSAAAPATSTPGKSSPGGKSPVASPPRSSTPQKSPSTAPAAAGTPPRTSTPQKQSTPLGSKSSTPKQQPAGAIISKGSATATEATSTLKEGEATPSSSTTGTTKTQKTIKGKATPPKAKDRSQDPPENENEEQTTRLQAVMHVLADVYGVHAPERVSEVESIVTNHKEEIAAMLQAVESKYQLPEGSLLAQVEDNIAKTNNNNNKSNKKAATNGESLAKSVQSTSKRLVHDVVLDFFETHAKNRVDQVPALLQQYDGRQQELFQVLQKEFSKEDGYFKKILTARSKSAAAALVQNSGGEGGGVSTKNGKSAPSTSKTNDVWAVVEKQAASADSSAPTTRTYTFREQLQYLCDKYCPPKASQIDKALRVYRGREAELISQLHASYGVTNAAEYLPSPTDPATAADAARGPAVERLPESMRAAVDLARHFGLGPQFVPKTLDQYGRDDERKIMFEVLATLFPDAMMHALVDEDQRTAFAARRITQFLSYHHPTAKNVVGKIVEQYAKAGKTSEALGDLLVRYYGPTLQSVQIKSFSPTDLASSSPAGSDGDPSPGLSSPMSSRSLRQQLDTIDASPTNGGASRSDYSVDPAAEMASLGTTAEVVLRRREFRRCVEEWSQQYSASSPFSRSTPRFLGRMAEMYSESTSTADLPRSVADAGCITLHREQEEARLLNLVERGMCTDPFTFEISSYEDLRAKQRRRFGTEGSSNPSLAEMRMERHREMYGKNCDVAGGAFGGKTPIPNPMIFLEDEDCSKCRVLQHQLDAATQRLHGLRAQQQQRERYAQYQAMERQAASDALLTSPTNRDAYGKGDVDVAAYCTSCASLREQVQSLSAKLHSVRAHKMLHDVTSTSDNSTFGMDRFAQLPFSPSSYRSKCKDAQVNTDLDSRKFSDLRSYFLLDAL